MKSIIFSICVFVLILFGSSTQAAEAIVPCASLSSSNLNKLDEVYSLGEIRVFYTRKNPASGTSHKLPAHSTADTNNNHVPDFVENIALQAGISREAFNSLGFPDPLESARYRVSKRIDINLLNFSGNGVAYDKAVRYPSAPNRGNVCTLRIDISVNLQDKAPFTTRWFIVTHEMFHLFQYGQTLFKRRWMNEATAKWAEYALRPRSFYPLGTPTYTLPKTKCELLDIVASPHSARANRLWSRLADLLGLLEGDIRLDSDLLDARYVDGNFVLKDATLEGSGIVNAVYQTLGAEDDIVSYVKGWPYHDWAEPNQTSSTHDPRIFQAIKRVIVQINSADPEVTGFLDAIDQFDDPGISCP